MMTFQQIADVLSRETGRPVTQQAVRQSYFRALRKLLARPETVENMRGLSSILQQERRIRVKGGLDELRQLNASLR
jgi:hypothetical protein